MNDDQRQSIQDEKFISLGEQHSILYWTDLLGCTAMELRKAVAAVERIVNAVRSAAPHAAIAFNTSPQDTADAAARWV